MTPKTKMIPLTKISKWQNGLPVNTGASRALSAAAEQALLKGEEFITAKTLLEGLARVSTPELDLPGLVVAAARELNDHNQPRRANAKWKDVPRGAEIRDVPDVPGDPLPNVTKLIKALMGQ